MAERAIEEVLRRRGFRPFSELDAAARDAVHAVCRRTRRPDPGRPELSRIWWRVDDDGVSSDDGTVYTWDPLDGVPK